MMDDEELDHHELDYLFQDASKEGPDAFIDWNARWSSLMPKILKFCDSHVVEARVTGIKLIHLFLDKLTEQFVVNQGLDGLLFETLARMLYHSEIEVTKATSAALTTLLRRHYKQDLEQSIVSKHDVVLIRMIDQIDLSKDVNRRIAYIDSLPALFDIMGYHLLKHTKRLNESFSWIFEEEVFPGNIDLISSTLDVFYHFLTMIWPRSSHHHLDLYMAKLLILKLKIVSNHLLSDDNRKPINERIVKCLRFIRETEPQSYQERLVILEEFKNLANMLSDCDKEELGFTSLSSNLLSSSSC